MIPWFIQNHNVAESYTNSITYLAIAYKRNYLLEKNKVKQRLMEEQGWREIGL